MELEASLLDSEFNTPTTTMPSVVIWYLRLVGLDIEQSRGDSRCKQIYKITVMTMCVIAMILTITALTINNYAVAITHVLYLCNSIVTWIMLHKLISFRSSNFQKLVDRVLNRNNNGATSKSADDIDLNIKKHIMVYLFVLYSAIAFVSIYIFTPYCIGEKPVLYDYVQSFITTFFNICSMYSLDVIVLFLSLFYVKNIDVFIENIENGEIKNIDDCKEQFNYLASTMKHLQFRLGFIVSFAFITHLFYAVFIAFLFLLDQDTFWTVCWCDHHIMAFTIQFMLQTTRVLALVYGPMLINTKSRTIPIKVIQHLQDSEDSSVVRFYLSIHGNTPIFRICWMDIYWGRFVAFVVGSATTLFAAFMKSAINGNT